MLPNTRIVLFWCAMLGSCLALAQGATPAPLSASQQAAVDILMRMANEISGAPRFQVDVLASYDSVQPDGQKIEFSEQRRLSVERPSLLLSETKNSDGSREYVLFDGQWITVNNTRDKAYARAPQPGDLDASIRYFLGALHMRMPLGIMLMRAFPDELQKRVIAIEAVEATDILGEPSQHIAGRTKDVDFQAWIATGKRPLPLRIVLTYREAPGQPQFRANFSNWKFNPSFLQKMFRFDPPPGSHELPLAASFAPVPRASATATPASTGELP